MNAAEPLMREPDPIKIDPRPCKLCGYAIEDLEELIYLGAADLKLAKRLLNLMAHNFPEEFSVATRGRPALRSIDRPRSAPSASHFLPIESR
jgi:hypothetical protein